MIRLETIDFIVSTRHNAPMPYYACTITISDKFRDALTVALSQKGCLGSVEENSSITAYFPDTFDVKGLTNELRLLTAVLEKAGAENLSFSCELIPDQDWNESWKKSFTALDVGERFTILPPWETPHAARINLVIDPGMAFGTGHHETTRSCLVLMEKYDGTVPRNRFLDLGTGTGLLAIAASKLGYKTVFAVDTDPLATEATRLNIGLNNAGTIEIRDGSISEATGTFDCITANIISGVLILLAPDIAEHLAPSGIAILSGILAEQADEVQHEMEKAGLRLKERYPDDKWISLVVTK